MNSILSCPPPDYVNHTRTAAWLRLGKIAVFSILAGLAVAIGLALPPDAGQDAEAQGISNGYSYTRMICQEYGRQPGWHNVRDPIAGSDWRNDGGWAIVLVSSANIRRAEYSLTNSSMGGGGDYAQPTVNGALSNFLSGNTPQAYGLMPRDVIHDADGNQALVMNQSMQAIRDLDKDGVMSLGDLMTGIMSLNPNRYYYQVVTFTRTRVATPYGAQYVRWANMRWCR